VHDERLLRLADAWLAGLDAETFQGVLPALRRTFGTFAPPERRAIGEQAARLSDAATPAAADSGYDDLDPVRATVATRTVLAILGRPQ